MKFKGPKITFKGVASVFILVAAIAVSIWGISALLLMAGAPVLVAYGGAIVFDALGLWLADEASSVALTDESAGFHEVMTYLVVFASMYLNWLHADLAGMQYPIPYVLALFPLAAGILFYFILKRKTREARKIQERRVNRNPLLGGFTWLRFPIKSFKMWSKSVESNLPRARAQIPTYGEIEQGPINVGPATVGKPAEKAPKPKKITAKPQPAIAPAMSTQEISEPIAPVVTAKEEFKFGFQAPPTFTATKTRGMAIEAYQQGHRDPEQVAEWLGTDKVTVQKHFYAARKLENK